MAANRKIAFVDLDTRQIEITPIPDEWRRKYIGGRGLGTYLACRYAAPECDPLAPGNPVVVSAGLLAGTLSSPAPMTVLTAQSPLTGFLECAYLPGLFAAEMRWAGFDHLVVTGRARRWVSIFLHNGTIQIINTGDLKGRGITDAGRRLRRDLGGDDVKTLVIGTAGENRVRFATVADDAGRVTGRTGMGAVFGSKRMKALACRGSLDIEVKFPEQAILHRQAQPAIDRPADGKFPLDSSAKNSLGMLSPKTDPRLADLGLDFETLVRNIQWAAAAAGANSKTDVAALADQIARRKGPGKSLADGPLRAAARIGTDSMPVLDLIALYREKAPEWEAGFYAPPFSAPQRSSAQYRGKPGTVAHLDLSLRLLDCLGDRTCAGICPATGRLDLERVIELIRLNAGREIKARALQTAAYRCYALKRLYNLRAERAARREGCLEIVLDTPGGLALSPTAWEGIDLAAFKRSVNRHYQQNGWNRKTLVKKTVFERLGIAELWHQFK
ncbi:MAG: hypothetical protein GY697_16960 [Desulfobacterales bacterium]|nr:hypothetical protein [Desulfobacterales bacterium]